MEGQDTEGRTQESVQVDTVQTTETDAGKTAIVYTQEQVSKIQSTFEKKAREAEREAKQAKQQLEQTTADVSAMREQVNKLTVEIERRELEGLEDVPQAQKLIRLNQELRQRELHLSNQKAELAKTQREALEGLKFRDAMALSKDYDIDVDILMECDTYSDMLKKVLNVQKEKVTPTKVEAKKEVKVPEHIDSGVSSGSGKGRIWKASEIESMSPDERFAAHSEIAKAQKEGRIDHKK